MVHDYITRLLDLKNFFETNEFNQLFNIISQYDEIDQEDLKYKVRTIEGLSEEQFQRVVETVFHNLDDLIVADNNFSFPIFHVDYRGVTFNIMVGQGSTYWTFKTDEKMIK